MAEADPNRNSAGSGDLAVSVAVVVSPLLNLAPTAGSGPELRQIRPVLPLGRSRLAGSAKLSLCSDRRSVEVALHLDRGAPSAVRLRRISGHHLRGGAAAYEHDFLIVEIVAGAPELRRSLARFSLCERGSFLPFERVSDLRRLDIDLSELSASSIQGVHVEPAPAVSSFEQSQHNYFAERLLMEMKAAERSASVAATCRHLELANLYARRLGNSEASPAG